jgi:hypothetical protein
MMYAKPLGKVQCIETLQRHRRYVKEDEINVPRALGFR